MREVIANAPTAGNKARSGLSKEESARFFGLPPLIAGEDPAQYERIRAQISAAVQPLDFLEENLGQRRRQACLGDAAAALAHGGSAR
jgi:hypothetical protein